MNSAVRDRVNPWRLILAIVAMIAIAGCQLDVTTDVVVNPDGTGEVIVTAVADAELVAEVPTIADELVLDDIADAGWVIEGPTPTEDGGLELVLTHGFEGKDEATNLLRSLGPPFNDPSLGRGQDGDNATNTLRVNLGLPDGFATFADDELIGTLGDVPFSNRLETADADIEESFDAVLRIDLPGDVVANETNAEQLDDGRLQWTVPTDGSILEASARTEQVTPGGSEWARPVATAALIVLVAWLAVMSLFIGYVALARARRARQYRRRALP